MRPRRTYAVEIVSYPVAACDVHPFDEAPEWADSVVAHLPDGTLVDESRFIAVLDDLWQPAGWQPPEGSDLTGFWWPSTDKIYRSRSAATERARLIESFGAKVNILEADLDWTPIPEANARRKQARNAKRIAALQAQIDRLEAT